MEDALGRLDRLTQDEVRMAAAQGLKATHEVDERVKAVDDKVQRVDDGVQQVSDGVQQVDDRVQVVDDKVRDVDDKINLVIDGIQHFSQVTHTILNISHSARRRESKRGNTNPDRQSESFVIYSTLPWP